MKKVAILQSNYIPWRGYFDLISYVDEFILFDDVQYTKRDWRNRNIIKTSNGSQWLSIPVQAKGRYKQKIKDTLIVKESNWKTDHLKSIIGAYKKSTYFSEIINLLEPVYDRNFLFLSEVNREFIVTICNYLGIDTEITLSSDYKLIDGKSERLAGLVEQANGTDYISGPAAKKYLDLSVFKEKDINVSWFSYDGYTEYKQLWGDFIGNVSIIDLLFNCGPFSGSKLNHYKNPC